jgi:putative membrane protein insertion efficiency factor
MDPKPSCPQQTRDHHHQEGDLCCGAQPVETASKRSLPAGRGHHSSRPRSDRHSQTACADIARLGDKARISKGGEPHPKEHEVPPGKTSFAALISIWAVQSYRILLGPVLGGSCRFHPTCSQYAIDAFQKYGYWAALGKVLIRISANATLSIPGDMTRHSILTARGSNMQFKWNDQTRLLVLALVLSGAVLLAVYTLPSWPPKQSPPPEEPAQQDRPERNGRQNRLRPNGLQAHRAVTARGFHSAWPATLGKSAQGQ